MTKILLVGLSLVLAAGCSKPSNSSPDDFLVTKLRNPVPPWTRPADCRANIREVICLAEPVQPGKGADQNANLLRPCDPQHSLDYAPAFEALYDAYPPQLQKMFCSLRRIFVEKEFFGSAYAGGFTDSQSQQIDGAIIGIRQSLVENPLSLSAWATWKEQLNFGGDPKDFTPRFPYPTMTVSNQSRGDFMAFIFAHEFGHLFDFKNAINRFDGDEDSSAAIAGTWTSLSWATYSDRESASEFNFAKDLCFYSCQSPLSPTVAPELYRSFLDVNFISTYGSTNPYDDFAETLAYYYLATTLHKTLTVAYEPGHSFDATKRLQAPQLQSKFKYVESFLNSNPRYP